MLPPISSFKPRVAAPAVIAKKCASHLAKPTRTPPPSVRGHRITLKRPKRLAPQPLAVLGSSKRSISC